MNFTTFFYILAAAAFSVLAIPHNTNAWRMARGLPPLPPVRLRAARTLAARISEPSGSPPAQNQCSTGQMQCCDTVGYANDGGVVENELSVLGAVLQGNPLVGLSCTPISVLGVGSGAKCNQQAVCCQNNQFNGLVNIGCTPININL